MSRSMSVACRTRRPGAVTASQERSVVGWGRLAGCSISLLDQTFLMKQAASTSDQTERKY
jgi:hypothetical protein